MKFKRVFWQVLVAALVMMALGYAILMAVIPLSAFDPIPALIAILIMGLGGIGFAGILIWWFIATIVARNHSNPPRPVEVVVIIVLAGVIGVLCVPRLRSYSLIFAVASNPP